MLRYTLFLAFLICTCFAQNELQAQEEIIGNGNTPNVQVSTSSEEPAQYGTNTLSGIGKLPNLAAASRFLGHATLGADYELIDTVTQIGYREWLEEQLAIDSALSLERLMKDWRIIGYDSILADTSNDSSDYYMYTHTFHFAWWQYVMNSPDLVRARVALALSEIFVISEFPDLGDYPLTLANYYDMLVEHSFGNYRDLLGDVSRHPAMGYYLTHLNNYKSDTTINRFPDENYAREIMQLFSIGLYMLNQDGTHILDTAGYSIPTYTNDEIAELAKVFTGFTWAGATEFGDWYEYESDWLNPMIMFDEYHEPGPKYIVNGYTIQDRNPVDGMADFEDALDSLFNHPNVGPFISRLLIQRLVRSNPSPDYIGRVAGVFNDNGEGVRGDLKAVTRAILLDPEALNCSSISDPNAGMLIEPIVRHTNIYRAFNAESEEGLYRHDMDDFLEATEQRPLSSPSVFNFFKPGYQPIGPIADENLVGPEFEILNSQSAIGYGTILHEWTLENDLNEWHRIYPGEDYNSTHEVNIDFSDELQLAIDGDIGDLIERLNLILVHGNLTDYSRNIIYETLSKIPEDDPEMIANMALFLIMISPDYLILK